MYLKWILIYNFAAVSDPKFVQLCCLTKWLGLKLQEMIILVQLQNFFGPIVTCVKSVDIVICYGKNNGQ